MARTVHTLRPGKRDAVPVFVHEAGRGPAVAITANIHGDEATGVAAVQEIDAWLAGHLTSGTVLLYPSLNPLGLHARTRVMPEGLDLNRLFPGQTEGNHGERHAAAIWSDLTVRRLTLLIDLHADSARSVPYAIIDRALSRGRGSTLGPALRTYAEASGLTVLHEYPDEQYIRYSLDRSLAGAMVNRANVPAVTLEAGPRRWIHQPAVDAVVGALQGMLAAVGVVDGSTVAHPSRVLGGPWRRAAAPRARREGIFREHIAPGATFEAGDLLGTVVDLTGEVLDELRAPTRGLVVSWAEVTWLEPGGVPGTLGLLES